MSEFNNTAELIQAWPGLNDDDRALLGSVVSSRGKWKGYVLANAPAAGRDSKRCAAWQAIMAELAPARVGVYTLMIMDDDSKALFESLGRVMRGGLGFALRVYEPPYRWSLAAHHYDIDAARASVFNYCHRMDAEANGQGSLL